MQFAWLVHHVFKRVWGPNCPLRSFTGLHPPTASCSPWFILLLNSSYLSIAILSIQLLIFSLVETIVVEVGSGIVEVVARGGVVEVVVALHLTPFAPIGTCFCQLLLLSRRLPLNEAVSTQ